MLIQCLIAACHKPNKSLHLTLIPLRFIRANELGRWEAMKRFSQFLLLFALNGAFAETLPSIGDDFLIPSQSNQVQTSPSQFWPYQDLRIDGLTYRIAVNSKGRVAYIAAGDPSFKTPEGLSVGAPLSEVLSLGAQFPSCERGWACHTKLASGWSVAFIAGSGTADEPLLPSSKIIWFFKRR